MMDGQGFLPTLTGLSAEQRSAPNGAEQVRAKILIVDDDQRNLLAASEILADPAIDLVLANSPEEALRRALREDFALILLDVQMPRMDGYEVASLIRSRSRTSRVPILFLTAHNKDDIHIFRGYSAGAVDYVFKPIQPLVLKSKVDVFVDLYLKTAEIQRKAAAEKQLLLENLRVRGEKLVAEQALRRREEHQAAVLRGLPIALYTSPLDGEDRRLQFTNDSIERITGFPRAAFAASNLWEAQIEPDDRDRTCADLRTVPEAGAVALEYRWRNADGSERHILDQIVVNRDENGAPIELFGMWFDVTERKELELSLQHASKLEAVGRLTGGIAHDFNNMLSIVIGNLDLVKGSLQGNERALRRIEAAAGLFPALSASAASAGSRELHTGPSQALGTHPRGADRDFRGVGGRRARGLRRSCAIRGGPDQPRRERAGCDAGRRDAGHWHQAARGGAGGRRGGAVGRDRGRRFGHGDVARDPRPRF
jgi:PAS domain S-box-containing protein